MHRDYLQSAPGHPVSGDGAVNAARKQQRGPSAAAHRDPARAGQLRAVDISPLFSDFHRYAAVRVVQIHPQMWEGIQNNASQFAADGGGVHTKAFVGALCIHAEAPRGGKFPAKVVQRLPANGIPVFFSNPRTAKRGNSKHRLQPAQCLSHVDILLQRCDINGGLTFPDLEGTEVGQPAAGIFNHTVLKGVTVEALEHQLAGLKQDDFIHQRGILLVFWTPQRRAASVFRKSS